jgi:hypothetical protein
VTETGRALAWPVTMQGRMFFFEKKNQKTFVPWRTWPGWRVPQVTKVFCFFSSEKKNPYPSAASRAA